MCRRKITQEWIETATERAAICYRIKVFESFAFCFGCDQYMLLWGVIARSGSAKHLVNCAKGKGNQRVWTTASVKRHSRRPCVSH